MTAGKPGLDYHQPDNNTLESLLARSASITRVSSPPNIPWGDDKWPFLWIPSMEPATMLEAGPIDIPFDHPLFQSHHPRYDISESTYYKI